TETQLEMLREELGLNEPYIIQYGKFIGNILQGDLGKSIHSKESIAVELLHRLPATIELTVFALCLAIIVGILAGVIAAVKQYSWFDNICMTGALFGVSMPIFWLGLMMILLF